MVVGRTDAERDATKRRQNGGAQGGDNANGTFAKSCRGECVAQVG